MSVAWNMQSGALRYKVKVYRPSKVADGKGGWTPTAQEIGTFSMDFNGFNGFPLQRQNVNFQAVQVEFISRYQVGLKVEKGDIFMLDGQYYATYRRKKLGNREALSWQAREIDGKDIEYLPKL